jgi:hypothetical protein
LFKNNKIKIINTNIKTGNMTVKYTDFISVYPDQNDPNIQNLITAKKEFNELESHISEPIPKKGEFYPHQDLTARLIDNGGDTIIIHDTGTGKTCTFIDFAEMVKNSNGIYDKVYVAEKGPSTINDFKNQIICKCTNGIYETDIIRNAKDDTRRKSNITRSIGTWYNVTTYGGLAKMVTKRNLTDQQIIDEFSGSIFFIDEAHNLRNDGGETKSKDLRQIYDVLHRIFHVAKRIKVIIATATPMINDVNEIPRLMNLILPMNNQMPENWDYRMVTKEQMEPFFRGKVTFVRGLDTGAVPVYQGETLDAVYKMIVPDDEKILEEGWNERVGEDNENKEDDSFFNKLSYDEKMSKIKSIKQPLPPSITKTIKSKIIVYPTLMSKHQKIGYLNAMNRQKNISDGSIGNNKKNKTQFRMAERQASCAVFPDGSYGGMFPRQYKEQNESHSNSGLGKYIKSSAIDVYETIPSFLEQISSLEGIYDLSCKFYSIIKLVMEENGASFVFSELLTGGGVILLGQCFEAMGFERYNDSRSAFIAQSMNDIPISICDSGSGTHKIRPEIIKKPRFALLTSENSSKGDNIRELFNSDENVNGDYIKVIIGSQVARDGINLSHILSGHLAGGGWHPSGMYQALSRFLRATSHEYILSVKREKKYNKLILLGFSHEEAELEANKEKIEVKIYKHAAIYEETHDVNIDELDKDELVMAIHKIIEEDAKIELDNQQYERMIEIGDNDEELANLDKLVKDREEEINKELIEIDANLNEQSEEELRNILREKGKETVELTHGTKQSIDLELYEYSEKKDLHIKRVMRMLQQIAVDAKIHYNRNIRENDIDGSPVCNYDLCKYIDRPLPVKIDYSTYDIKYSDKIVDQCIGDLIILLRKRGSITFKELKEKWFLPESQDYYPAIEPKKFGYREKIIYMAIDKILLEKRQLYDKYGFTCYLYVDNNNIYTQREFPVDINVKGQPELSIYGEEMIGVSTISFEQLVILQQSGNQITIIEEMMELEYPMSREGVPNNENLDLVKFNIGLDKLLIESKIKLLENAINDSINNVTPSIFSEAIIARFTSYIFQFPEPWEDIENTTENLKLKGLNSGRKAKITTKPKPNIKFIGSSENNTINRITGEEVENIFVHTLYGSKPKLTEYGNIARSTSTNERIRIYKASEGLGWRDANDYEFPAYKNMIDLLINKQREEFDLHNIYGILSKEGNFHIRDKTNETLVYTAKGEISKRSKNYGRNCSAWSKPKLVDLLWVEKIYPEHIRNTLVPSKELIINNLYGHGYNNDKSLMEKFPIERLEFLYKWYNSKYTQIINICKYLQEYFEMNGRLQIL